jgi:methyl-accepting chemotaxis protein
MRGTAQVASVLDASGRAVAAASATSNPQCLHHRGRRGTRLRSRRSAAGAPSASAVEQAGQRTDKSVSEIESLAAATQRIDGMLTLIQAIARPTCWRSRHHRSRARNVPAAAFAVVAHEVKALAGQTAKATAEISEYRHDSTSTQPVDAVREIGNAVREINNVTSSIAGAIGQQDQATREISQNAQLAAQGNQTLVDNIGSLSQAMGKTSTAAESVLSASSELTATAETLSREVEKFFQTLRADPHQGMLKTGT